MADPENITARTALDPLDIVIGGPSDAGVTLAEIPFQTRLVLRGQPTDSKFMAAVKKALGIAADRTGRRRQREGHACAVDRPERMDDL